MVEYPGDAEMIANVLADGSVDPRGRDMFGLSACHKFCAWDKAELLELLLPHLSPEDLRRLGGPQKQTPLHAIAEEGAQRALRVLLAASSELELAAALEVVDAAGRTPLALASERGHEAIASALRSVRP